jgi:hypothetical protein
VALDPTSLATSLGSTFVGVSDFVSAGRGWAAAYKSYAQAAQAGVTVPTFTGLEEGVLASGLAAAFAAGIADPAGTPQRMEVAFQAFWMVPPVVFGAGVTTLAPPGLSALIAATYPLNVVSSATGAATNIALALDAWTRLVTVTLPGPVVVTLLCRLAGDCF